MSMANKLTQTQSKSRYLEAVNNLTPLTMLTGQEALTLARAGQEQIGSNEELIYKYRDEFLHIQRAAEQGLTELYMLVENPNEFNIVATAWGFNCLVEDRFDLKIVYRKNLGKEQVNNKLSNILVSWLSPKKPTIDVAYYRQTGNLVQLEDSTISIPLLSNRLYAIKSELGILDNTRYTQTQTYDFTKTGQGRGGLLAVSITSGNPYVLAGPITNGGSGYVVGNTIRFPSYRFFKDIYDSRYNLTITVTSVDKYGAILTVGLSGIGIPGANYGHTVLNLETGGLTLSPNETYFGQDFGQQG